MGLVTRRAAVLACGAALTAMTGVASAQEQAATTTTQKQARVTVLQRLVVGAGEDKIAIDTPQAVTVVEQEEIDREQATSTGDVFREIPGVTMVGSDRIFGEAFNIRGVGATDNSADGSRIVVTVDGAPKFNEQYRMGSFFSDPELYKRVEVLRGPASSTLYGSGALGGVIRFETKDASDLIAEGQRGVIKLKGSYASNGNGALGSVIWAHRFGEQAEVLLAGNYRRSDAFRLANGGVLSGSDFQSWSGLAKGTFRFGDANEQAIRISYQRWNSDAQDQDYAQSGTQAMFGTTDRTVVDDTVVLSYENPASDNPWLDLNVALTYSNTANSQSGWNPGVPPLPRPPLNDTSGTAILNDTDYAYQTYQLKADNTMEWLGDRWSNHLTYGVQASLQNRKAGRPTGAAALQQHPEGSEAKVGVFVQNEYVFDERLTLIAGVRGDYHNMSPAAGIVGANVVSGVAFSPKIAAMYDFTENFGIFGSVAHTERFPTLDELFSRSATRTVSLGLQKELSNNYELGFVASAYDIGGGSNALTFKVTGFYNDLTNLIASTTTDPAFAGRGYFTNVNAARIYGGEAEGAFESDYFYARLAYAHVVGENKATGAPLTTVPQNVGTLTLGGRVPDYFLDFGARLTVAQAGAYSVPVASGAVGSADPWTTVDLFASWKPQEGFMRGFEVLGSVENVFNADYRPNLAIDRSKARTFKITLAKSFGY
ncbi:MAG: TonB-dependent receptor [Rhizobiaceae bacterium]|nr:TonB-dependent receptor [Rhizobiaceae bacterium]